MLIESNKTPMTRGYVREHWREQAQVAFYGLATAFLSVLTMALLRMIFTDALLPAATFGFLVVEVLMAGRVLYCVYRFRNVGRKK